MFLQIINNITVFVTVLLAPQPEPELPEMPNAESIKDPERFVELTHKLLSIFPNGMNVTQVLDPSPLNGFVSADDALTVAEVVPELRKMLRNTPIEQERQASRNRCAESKAKVLRVIKNVFTDAARASLRRELDKFNY